MPPTGENIFRILNNTPSLQTQLEQIQQYITNGGDVNAKFRGKTALMELAIQDPYSDEEDENIMKLVNLLMETGANPTIISVSTDEDSIFMAIDVYNSEIAARLLQYPGVNVNNHFSGGKTYLHAAIANGDIDTVRLLISMGASVNEADNTGDTPLITLQRNHIYSHDNIKDITRLLLDSGADKNIYNKERKCAYDYAKPNDIGDELYQALKPDVPRPNEANNNNNSNNRRNNNNNNNNNSNNRRNNNNNNNSQNRFLLAKYVTNTKATILEDAQPFPIQEPITVFDPIEGEEFTLSIKNIVEDSFKNIYFKVDNSFFRLSHEYILHSIAQYNNITFECNKEKQGAPVIGDIIAEQPFFLLRTSGVYAVPLGELKRALKNLDSVFELNRVYELKLKRTADYTASFGSIQSGRYEEGYNSNNSNNNNNNNSNNRRQIYTFALNYAGRRVNIIGADHCKGSPRKIYSLYPLELKPLAAAVVQSGGKKRKTRRRIITRRRRSHHTKGSKFKNKTYSSKRH